LSGPLANAQGPCGEATYGRRMDTTTTSTAKSERDTVAAQNAPRDSRTLDDPEVDAAQVKSLPGVGGIDDAGDVEVDPGDLHMPHRTAPVEPRG
jgi:hypothetical protein